MFKMDHNILLKIAILTNDETELQSLPSVRSNIKRDLPTNFKNFLKAFPYLIKSSYHFNLIYNLNINDKKIDMNLLVNNPYDISICERIIRCVRKTLKCDDFKVIYNNEYKTIGFRLLNLEKNNLFDNINICKKNPSIKSRLLTLHVCVNDYKDIINNLFTNDNIKLVVINNIEAIPLNRIYIKDEYLRIKF
jgi:hypothetical protein